MGGVETERSVIVAKVVGVVKAAAAEIADAVTPPISVIESEVEAVGGMLLHFDLKAVVVAGVAIARVIDSLFKSELVIERPAWIDSAGAQYRLIDVGVLVKVLAPRTATKIAAWRSGPP